jgi:uncharacterized membrane protein YbhN (UPF0104 family)
LRLYLPAFVADSRSMALLARAWGCRTVRLGLNISYALGAVLVAVLAGKHFASAGWPLADADWRLVAGSGLLFMLAYAFKAYGWHRLFAPNDRPTRLALAAAGGAASVSGAALPGRFDDAVRIAVVRRYPGCHSGVGTLCLSLFMLGLVDTAALLPFASAAAATSNGSGMVRMAMGIVAVAGLAACVLITFLPRMAANGRLLRYRIVRWVNERTTSPREAWRAWVLVGLSWLARAVGLFLLLGALGIDLSFPIAIAFLCGAAATGALPIAPAGAATQAGAGAAILIGSGFATAEAVSFAVAAQALLILAGAAVLICATAWTGGSKLNALRRAYA